MTSPQPVPAGRDSKSWNEGWHVGWDTARAFPTIEKNGEDRVIPAEVVCDCGATPGDHPYDQTSCVPLQGEEVTDETLTAWAAGTHTLGMVPRLIYAVQAARAQRDQEVTWGRARTEEFTSALAQTVAVAEASLATAHADRDRWKATAMRYRDLNADVQRQRDLARAETEEQDARAELWREKANRADRLHRILDQLVWVKDGPRDATRGKKAGAWDAARDAVREDTTAALLARLGPCGIKHGGDDGPRCTKPRGRCWQAGDVEVQAAPPGDVALIAGFLAAHDGDHDDPAPWHTGTAVHLVDHLLAAGYEILRRIA